MDTILFQTAEHQCVIFSGDDSHQTTRRRALIRHGDATAVIDPAGQLAFGPLAMAVSRHAPLGELSYVFSAHDDPNAIPRLERWLTGTDTRIVTSREWIRLSSGDCDPRTESRRKRRFLLLGQRGGRVQLGKSELRVLPALPAQSVGQPAIFDPVSRILFSGDVGATELDQSAFCENFDALLPLLASRQPAYLTDTRGCREWALIARDLRPHMIMPNSGAPMIGKQTVGRFLDWLESAGSRMVQAA